jgi:hypothetical protein
MARTIADGEVRATYAPTVANTSAPTVAEVETAGTDITPFLSSLDTPLDGDAPDSSDLASAFNKSVAGTFGGGATGTFYRDDTTDTAWTTFPRLDEGYITIRRFGGSGVAMVATDDVEVWHVRVITRSPATLDRNSVQMFTVDFATLAEPVMDAVVA